LEKFFFESYGTYIHPTSIISNKVTLGENVKIGPFCVVVGNVAIGSNTRLHGHLSIGMPAQDLNTKKALGTIEIGQHCDIREFVTISAPKNAASKTKIGDHCYIMNFCHIAHDVTLEDHVTLINNVNLAGHVHVEHNVMLMANTGIHQFCRIGAYSALTPYSGMRQDLPPFCMFNGAPGRFAGLNLVALKRAGWTTNDRNGIKTITKLFFQDKLPFDTIKQHVGTNIPLKQSEYVQQFLNFVQNSSRGISRKTIKD